MALYIIVFCLSIVFRGNEYCQKIVVSNKSLFMCNTFLWSKWDNIVVDKDGWNPILINTDKNDKCEYEKI
jgi:hypothetical protein